MHELLWAGVELKIENAEFFLEKMGQAVAPPERTQLNVALQSAEAIIDTGWQRSFYAYLDAFLAMVRSVPEIIQACFGEDQGPRVMRIWFDALAPTEKTRRNQFTDQFRAAYCAFRRLPLSNARNISLHRTGVAPVEVNITGRFGLSHVGTPIQRVPIAETRPIVAGDDSSLQWAATLPSAPVQPVWMDFRIDGRPLFPECRTYLQEAGNLLTQARGISQRVHGSDSLTPTP